MGSPLQFDVQRASYTKPVTITQIIYPPSGGTVRRALPASTINGFNYGLTRFLKLTARNSAGKVAAAETIPFCPNSYDPERAGPGSPQTTPYPQQCATDPFPLSTVWGVQKDWATDPAETNFLGHRVKLPVGVYRVTGTITPRIHQAVPHPGPRRHDHRQGQGGQGPRMLPGSRLLPPGQAE
jgi:hypothetical protein